MRIDYNDSKRTYTSQPVTTQRPRKESSIPIVPIAVASIISLAVGFGSGWFLSQKATKRSFQAALEQQSLENTPKNEQPQQKSVATNPSNQNAAPQATPSSGAQPNLPNSAENQQGLSFYKTLPNGEKSGMLGSGINAKEEQNKKAPLQAAIPANLQQTAPQNNNSQEKTAPAKNVQSANTKTSGGFTVQVSSFPLKSEAEQSRAKFTAKGYAAYIVESNQGEKGTWHRVRIGKGMDQNSAKELAAKIGKSAMVLPDNQ